MVSWHRQYLVHSHSLIAAGHSLLAKPFIKSVDPKFQLNQALDNFLVGFVQC